MRLVNGVLERYIGYNWRTWALPEVWSYFMTETIYVRNFGNNHLLDCYYNMYSVDCYQTMHQIFSIG